MKSYAYRRKLTPRELVPAIGVGLGVGVAVAYLTQIVLRREPLAPGQRADRG